MELAALPWIKKYDTFTQIALLSGLARVEGQSLSEEAMDLMASYMAEEES